jgi:hypothetical protein
MITRFSSSSSLFFLTFVAIIISSLVFTFLISRLFTNSKKISGSVKENGEAQLTINLASLETLIPIRNERMGKLLFETKIYPSAFFKLEVDLEKILLTEVGKSSEVEYRGMFGFKNKQFPLLVKLKVTRLSDQSFSVSSLEPLLLNADRLGLSNGIEALRAVAGLPSISKSVPVTFSLMFRK